MLKRLFDIVASLTGLILFSPLLLAIALWVKLDSPGPVFYRGRRAGRNGTPFKIYKFRSMVTNADKIGGPSTSGDDPRSYAQRPVCAEVQVGRGVAVDQRVGGRHESGGSAPEVVDKVEKFDAEARKTLVLRPGITDWASIWNCDEGGVLAGARMRTRLTRRSSFPQN